MPKTMEYETFLSIGLICGCNKAVRLKEKLHLNKMDISIIGPRLYQDEPKEECLKLFVLHLSFTI